MSQVSHLNRLWEEVKEEQSFQGLAPITYSILVADLPMEQVVMLTRVLSFINVGIGSSVPTKKLGGTCDPKTMTLTSCAPLNGQPQIVSVEKGVERDLKGMNPLIKGTGFFLSHVSAPVDVQTYFNATYVATTNGRSVGVFEHDVDQVTNLGRNPFGHLYIVNNQDFILPSSLLRTTGIQQSWLDRPDASVITEIETIAHDIGEQQTKLLKSNPQGNVSQPVYGLVEKGNPLYDKDLPCFDTVSANWPEDLNRRHPRPVSKSKIGTHCGIKDGVSRRFPNKNRASFFCILLYPLMSHNTITI